MKDCPAIKIGVAYATSETQVWREFECAPGCCVGDAINQSGILDEFPEIDLNEQKIGIFGAMVELDDKVCEGDRVEIYRPIKVDPEVLERKKYKLRRIESVVEKAPDR